MNFIKKVAHGITYRVLLFIAKYLPLDNKKVLFSSYYGRGYGDNPKYIAEALLKTPNKCKLYWIVNNRKEKETLPKEIRAVMKNSLKHLYHLATARVWVDNCRRYFPYKKKKQYYIQTWHGFALKRIEGDVEDKISASYIQNAKKDSAAIDVIVSEAEFMSKIYRRAFWYNGEICLWGAPRNDIMFNKNAQKLSKSKICQTFNLSFETKIVLYAPTFRSDGSLKPYNIDYKNIVSACEKRFGGKFIAFSRLHPNIMEKSKELMLDEEKVVDASSYADMQELLAASDVVISDYSSLMFDFALSGKPCFQFATDIKEYKQDRNFYFQLDELPFPISENNDSLINEILFFDFHLYTEKLEVFWEKTGMILEGSASEHCANRILEICKLR